MEFFKKGILVIAVIISLTLPVTVFSQGGPPPPPSDHGTDGNQAPRGSAPIGGGLFILMGLGAIYGGKKVYDLGKENLEE